MRFNLKSRFFQISFVSASLLFLIWLCVSLWMDALEHRSDARRIQDASVQEEVLFNLAAAVSKQRQMFYRLFSSSESNPAAIDKLRELSRRNHSAVLDNIELTSTKSTSHSHHHKTQNSNAHAPNPMPTINDAQVGHLSMQDNNENHQHHSGGTIEHTFSLTEISKQLVADDKAIYSQLALSRGLRKPMYGMQKFHDYSTIVESLDNIRRTLHLIPKDSKREFYTHTKIKDSIWNLREAVLQITTLIQGIYEMNGTSAEMAQTRHNADMLMELNVRVTLAWNELLKLSNASENDTLRSNAMLMSTWYTDNFKELSTRLAASSRYNTVTQSELRTWLGLTEQFLQRTENLYSDSKKITLDSVKHVEQRATRNLLLVSVLLMFAIGMAIASLYFFRRVDKQAHQDELTGLDNRRMFSVKLNKYIAAAKSTNSDIGMLMIDLDQFKYTNDTMGHAAGDSLLKKVAQRIIEVVTDSKSIARLGGDEFAILFPGSNIEQIKQAATEIQKQLMEPFIIDGATINIGSSIGIALFPRDANTHDLLIQAADLAMYRAKKSGTNQIVEYDTELEQTMAGSARTVTELKSAIHLEQFELYYQPQFNLALNQVVSAEALIRWNHPERGFVSPFDFIPLAEENGLMPAIGNWVINEACKQAAIWLHEDKTPLRIAVNISADHFFQPDFVESIMETLEKHKLPPQYLELEVTESVAVNDMDMVVNSLKKLRDSSIQVALDDFGTGYSSLSYLQDLPLDTLKIDKSFIQKMLLGNVQHDSITETIVSLGKSLSLETVAEGVETEDQLAAVSNMRISVVQGYYYSKPVAADEMLSVVQKINDANEIDKAA